MFSALAARSLSIILQKNRSPVALKQNVVQVSVSLSLQKIPVPTDRFHEVIIAYQFSLCRAAGVEFFFVELTMVNLLPKDNPPPECPRMLGWTANDASTHHFKIPLPLALRISGSVRLPLMCLIVWTNLAQSYRSCAQTILVRNATAVKVSGLACLVAYKVSATRL